MQRISLAAHGSTIVPVVVERAGYPGKIELSANVPAGVKLEGTTIPEGADRRLVTLSRADAGFEAAITTWRGRTDLGSEQAVLLKGHPLERLQPWLATEIAMAPTTAKANDLLVQWRDNLQDAGLVLGTKLAASRRR